MRCKIRNPTDLAAKIRIRRIRILVTSLVHYEPGCEFDLRRSRAVLAVSLKLQLVLLESFRKDCFRVVAPDQMH